MTDTRTRLLDAVDRVIAEHGPSGVTVRRVGETAGLSHTAGTHHFGSKRGLFTAYVTRAWGRVADDLVRFAADRADPDAMVDLGVAYAEFALREPSAFSVMSRLELTDVDTPELWAERERGFLTAAALVERCQAAGWATDRDPLDLLAAQWALTHGFTALWVGGPLSAPYDGHELVPTLRRVLGALVADVA